MGAVGQVEPFQACGEPFVDFDEDGPMQAQQGLDAVVVLDQFTAQAFVLAVQTSSILDFGAWHMNHGPNAMFPTVVADELVKELRRIDSIVLDPASAAADKDTAGVHDQVVDSLVFEQAVDPEALESGLVTANHRGFWLQAETPFHFRDLPTDLEEMGVRNVLKAPFSASDAETQLPTLVTDLHCHVQFTH